jgi:hypothetical protein
MSESREARERAPRVSGGCNHFLLDNSRQRVYDELTMERKNIHLTAQQIEALRALSDKTGLTVAEHVRRAIDEYVAKQEKG